MQRWAKWFAERGHEVHLISPDDEDIEGVKIHLIGKKKEGSVTNFVRKMFQTRKLVWKIKPDILHAHYAFGHGTFAAFANYHPFVVSVWGRDIITTPHKSVIFRCLVKYVLKKADYITVFSEYLKNEVTNLLKSNKGIDVIVPWDSKMYEEVDSKLVDKFKKELNIPDDAFVILSPRNMVEELRVENIIRSIPDVIKRYPNTIFILLKGSCNEDYFKKVKRLINELSINKNTRLIERWLDEKEMTALYTISHATISLPIIDQFSGTVRESMMHGCVPIVSSVPIYTSILKDKENAIFVSGDDIKDISDKIVNLIENKDLLEKIKRNNRTFVYEYEKKEKKLDYMEKMYEKLIEKK